MKALRLDIKGLQKDFDTTEENIKALQSVGQIIGEVLKQLDEERCKSKQMDAVNEGYGSYSVLYLLSLSYRQSLIRPSIRCRLPIKSRQSQAKARNTGRVRYDYSHYHANATARSRPLGIQHVLGRPGSDQLWRNRWSERSNSRTTGGHRTAVEEPRAIFAGWNQAAKRGVAIRSAWHWQNVSIFSFYLPLLEGGVTL